MTQPTTPPPSASDIRRRARGILDGARGQRLTLAVAVTVVLTASVGTFILGEAAYTVACLCMGESLWADVIAYGVMGVLGLFGVLPLLLGAYRLACLAYPPRNNVTKLPVTTKAPEIADLFYPFTSLRAYGRTFSLALGLLGWITVILVIPLVGHRATAYLYAYLVEEAILMASWRLPLTIMTGLMWLSLGLLMLLLSGYRAGFAYLVFVHEPLSVGEIRRYFKGFRRTLSRPLVLRVSLLGWVAVSIAAVLVPFVAHTIPYGMCCSAVYGAELQRK